MMRQLGMSLLVFSLFVISFTTGYSQVRGLSYTISPFAEYDWFGSNSGLKDGYFAGAQLGIGFGENVELRGLYSRSLALKTDLSNFGFDVSDLALVEYVSKDVFVERYGGELKLNLSRGKFLPYVTLGTGVQSIGFDTLDAQKQIYLSGGLGIKYTAGNRYTIGIQAVNNRYNFSAVNSLLSNDERLDYDLLPSDFPAEQVSNFGLKASLIFYLGGRKPGKMTDVDKAYWDNFSGGYRGLNVPIEVQFSKMNFNEDLPYASTWMAGGSAGFNFGPLVGVRAFYWRALEEESFSQFDDLAMYGIEGRFKLNDGKGLTPWITIGGGVIDVLDGYTTTKDTSGAADKSFAMGGLGVDLPFSKYFKATGFARSVLTTTNELENIGSPSQIALSWNYGVSANFILGKTRKKVDVIKKTEFDDFVIASESDNEKAVNDLKADYESKIMELEDAMKTALEEKDLEAVQEIQQQKDQAKEIVSEIDKFSAKSAAVQKTVISENQSSIIRMTPSEFQLLLRDLQNNESRVNQIAPVQSPSIGNELSDYKKEQDIEALKEKINNLTKLVDKIATNQETTSEIYKTEMKLVLASIESKLANVTKENDKLIADMQRMKDRQLQIEGGLKSSDNVKIDSYNSAEVQNSIDEINSQIVDLNNEIIYLKNNGTIGNGSNDYPMNNQDRVQGIDNQDTTGIFSQLKYRGMSGFTGINVGGPTTFNLGYRLHYRLGGPNSDLEFMPESFFGLGSPSTFGLSANFIYNLQKLTKSNTINPYIGLGAGMMKVGDSVDQDKLAATYNFIVGTSLNVWSGDLYVDFTARNAFKYNQVIVGYRFPF